MTRKVLVVDADSTVRAALGDSLERAGYAVTLAASMDEASQHFHDEPAQVVILDHGLTQGNGGDFLDELREHHPEVERLLLASADAGADDNAAAMERVADGSFVRFFPKPLNTAEVLISVGESLQRRDLLEEARSHRATTWDDIADSAAPVPPGKQRYQRSSTAQLPSDPRELTELMRACLEARGGEVSARRGAARLGRAYLKFSAIGRRNFLRVLADEFGVDGNLVDAAIDEHRKATNVDERMRAEAGLRRALVAPRRRLLTQFNSLPDGVKFLVDLRADLHQICAETPQTRALDADLRQLLTSWFDPGFLDLRRITWESPAALLEKLIAYEALHEIRSWSDLRNRLGTVGRCYALFHPRMPNEPLVFVEIALCDGVATSVQDLIDQVDRAPRADPEQATTAVFYSISNTQEGLRGIRFGDVLIKRVVRTLGAELPELHTFVTLSPLPNMRAWLDQEGTTQRLPSLLTADQSTRIRSLGGDDNLAVALKLLLTQPGWHEKQSLRDVLEQPLRRICLAYLLDRRDNGEPTDPVARFHLKNGARLERINWLGDTSQQGLFRSFGSMVNYRYVRADLEENHELYAEQQRIVISDELAALADEIGLGRDQHGVSA